VVLSLLTLAFSLGASAARAQVDPVVRMVYFYRDDCAHCMAVIKEVLTPLQSQYGDQLQIKMVQFHDPDQPSELDPGKYEMLLRAEDMFGVTPEERGNPTLVVGGQVLIGEDAIREQLSCLLDSCLGTGGTAWPDIPGLETVGGESQEWTGFGLGLPIEEVEPCGEEDEMAACDPSAASIWAAYFYQVGCKECDRAESDIQYIQSRYPQFVDEEFNIYESVDLAQCLAGRVGREEDVHTPALFIGDDVLIGQEEITPQNLEALVAKYADTGAAKVWEECQTREVSLPAAMTVVVAGLVDGLNPCAFATLAFFVSYLALSGRKGREILIVGGAFTLGVFLAYLTVGLGFYKVLDLLGGLLTTLGRWVYGLTALLCAGLAVFSFLDFLKARQGDIGDMALNLPHRLRMRINAVIRRGRRSRAFVAGAFVTGIVVSFLELACTGQVYLPTIIFMVSRPEMQTRALVFLVLYNLLFILPLIVVFILVYYGTGSKQLTRFLQQRAATVKLGLTLLFAALATWLTISIVV
jgi:cytochrome c biogenesis protein CcdA/thiol-disulfide isomerase/thioredoxin